MMFGTITVGSERDEHEYMQRRVWPGATLSSYQVSTVLMLMINIDKCKVSIPHKRTMQTRKDRNEQDENLNLLSKNSE